MADRFPYFPRKPPGTRAEGATPVRDAEMISVVWTISGLLGLITLGIALAEPVGAASTQLAADIVYSARYYQPGTRPSHYKIWRINSAGSGLVQVTSGSTNDHSPIWLADGKTILFIREGAKRRTLCVVGERGGPVTELVALPGAYTFMVNSVAPDRRSVVLINSEWKVFLFDVATRQNRALGLGADTAWSPNSHRLYVSRAVSKSSAEIIDLATGRRLVLARDFGAATWLDDHTLVAEAVAPYQAGQPQLAILRADGVTEHEIPLPFTWQDDLSPFADTLFSIPGDADRILYGRHAGSSSGAAQAFYRVSLTTGQATVLANGRNLAWSSDHQFFATGDSRGLAPLDGRRHVWVRSLFIVALGNGEARTIVQGLVDVGEFDWRPAPASDSGRREPQ